MKLHNNVSDHFHEWGGCVTVTMYVTEMERPVQSGWTGPFLPHMDLNLGFGLP